MEVVTSRLAFEPIRKAPAPAPAAASTDYVKQAMDLFELFEIDGQFEELGVRRNIDTWLENKAKLMNMFRKHPLWNEEAKAIIFKNDELRKVDLNEAVRNINRMSNYVLDRLNTENPSYSIIHSLKRSFRNYKNTVVTEDFINEFMSHANAIPQHINSILRPGVRMTKLVNKIFSEVTTSNGIVDATKLEDDHEPGDRNYNSYQKYFAKFADNLSELNIKKITVMSLNFNDFMTMSNGNSWSSCHFINSHGIFHEDSDRSYQGMYKQGCLSYALDDCSFIFYTLPANYEGEEYYLQQKLNRMCCQYEDGILVTGKCYPDNNDDKITTYRQTMQFVISQCEGFSNSWTFSRNADKVKAFTVTAEGASQYPDYHYPDQKPTISMHKGSVLDFDTNIAIGHQSYCLCCGKENYYDDHSWLQCSKHRKNRLCPTCGVKLTEDVINIYDVLYCTDCAFYCDECGEYHTIDAGKNTIELNGITLTLCNYALRRFKICKKCGKWFRIIDKGAELCPECHKKAMEEALAAFDGVLKTVKKDIYEVGDYVIIKENLDGAHDIYISSEMKKGYAGKIVKITKARISGYYVTSLDNNEWKWPKDAFEFAIENGEEFMIGLNVKEVVK